MSEWEREREKDRERIVCIAQITIHTKLFRIVERSEQLRAIWANEQRIVATLKCEHLRWRFEMDWILNGHFIWYLVARRFQHSTVENEEMYVWHGMAVHGMAHLYRCRCRRCCRCCYCRRVRGFTHSLRVALTWVSASIRYENCCFYSWTNVHERV